MYIWDWQKRLEEHFSALAAERRVLGEAVFALEHGLTESELADLQAEVRRGIRLRPPQGQYSLVWVVYATEVGYRFGGNEYWTTFERETVGWREHGNRHDLRSWFQDFHRRFGGIEPRGQWADWFTIICWPVTNACLPLDLQVRLADILNESVHSFTPAILTSDERLGTLVKSRSHTASRRFQEFCTNPLLVGHIARALLGTRTEAHPALLPETFARVVRDLERTQSALISLGSARRGAADVLRGSGWTAGTSGQWRPPVGPPGTPPPPDAPLPSLRPRLLLRPGGRDAGWDPYLIFPDFSSLAARFAEVHDYLSRTRFRVPQGSRGWFGRSYLLGREAEDRLSAWPDAGQPLIAFEGAAAPPVPLPQFIGADLLFPAHGVWLFKRASSGAVHEVVGRTVAPGEEYLLLMRDGLPAIDGASPVRVNCSGVTGLRFRVPEFVDRALHERLRKHGITVARRIAVWPAGAPPAAWDGEGHITWLTTDSPVIALSLDHATTRVKLEITRTGAGIVLLEPEHFAGGPAYVRLPALSAGSHRLVASTLSAATDPPPAPSDGGSAGAPLKACGELAITVRAPQPWEPGTATQGALFVLADPPRPTLDELWSGEATFHVLGPHGTPLDGSLTFVDREERVLLEWPLPPLTLPLSQEAWKNAIVPLREHNAALAVIDDTYTVRVHLEASDLGAYGVDCEREITPFRWAARYSKATGHTVRLIDDTGGTGGVVVWHYPTNAPATPSQLPHSERDCSYVVPAAGGLYVASGDSSYAAIVAPPQVDLFAARQFAPAPPFERSPHALAPLMRAHRRWSTAGLVGHSLASWTQSVASSAITAAMRRFTNVQCPHGTVSHDALSAALLERYRAIKPDGEPISDEMFNKNGFLYLKEALTAACEVMAPVPVQAPVPPKQGDNSDDDDSKGGSDEPLEDFVPLTWKPGQPLPFRVGDEVQAKAPLGSGCTFPGCVTKRWTIDAFVPGVADFDVRCTGCGSTKRLTFHQLRQRVAGVRKALELA